VLVSDLHVRTLSENPHSHRGRGQNGSQTACNVSRVCHVGSDRVRRVVAIRAMFERAASFAAPTSFAHLK